MSTLNLPDNPDPQFYRKQAKALLKAYRAGEALARERIHAHLPHLAAHPDTNGVLCGLSDAQLAVARKCGFSSWPRLKSQIDSRRAEGASRPTPIENVIAAIHEGAADRVRQLLDADPSLIYQQAPDSSYSLLHHAAGSRTLRNAHRVAVVETILAHGFPVDTRLAGGETALHFAASLNHVAMVRALLDAGASPLLDGSGEGGTPLIHALFYGCVDTAELIAERSLAPGNLRVAAGLGRRELLDACFLPDGALTAAAGAGREFYRPHDEYPEWTPTRDPQEVLDESLMYACLNGRLEAAAYLLERGAHVNAMPYFATGLHFAAIQGNVPLVELLLAHGASPTIQDRHYHGVAWGWAWHAGKEAVKDQLLEIAAQGDLESAVVLGRAEPVLKLLEKGVEAAQLSQALATAMQQENAELVELLRAHGARPSFLTAAQNGLLDEVVARMPAEEPAAIQAAFDAAALAGHRAVCHALLSQGAALDIHNAAALDIVELVEQALAHGTDIDAREPGGNTPLHRAIYGGAVATVRLLLQRGADVELSHNGNSHGPRALHLAASCGAAQEIIDLLLTEDADINESSNDGTPVDCADRMGHAATASYLRERGGKTGKELNDWPAHRE